MWFYTRMFSCWLLLLVELTCAENASPLLNPEMTEFCERDAFEANCGDNEVIIIRHARYGRMREGRCITNTYGVMGCSRDVRPLLDMACGGRRHCEVMVANLVPEKSQPCPSDFRSYLEVAYQCVTVAVAPKEFCKPSGAIEIRGPRGYLSSLVAEETGCGSLDSPWWITVKPGQKIRLSLIDFSYSDKTSNRDSRICHVYAVIKEETRKQSETVCASFSRDSPAYTSLSNMVKVRLVTKRKQQQEPSYFVLKYEAIGCPDPTPPINGWFQRLAEEALVGCNDSARAQWHLLCENDKWVGTYNNCSGGMAMVGSSIGGWTMLTNSHGLSIVVILIIAVTVGLIILIIGLLYLRRHRARRGAQMSRTPLPVDEEYQQQRSKQGTYNRQNISKSNEQLDNYHSTENDYYRTWQLQRLGEAGSMPRHAHRNHPMVPVPAPPPYTEQGTSGTQAGHNDRYSEHIYESPKFERKDFTSSGYTTEELQTEYFELDPESIDRNHKKPNGL